MYTLSISDQFQTIVNLTLKEGLVNKKYSVTLTATRKSTDEIDEFLKNTENKITDFLHSVITDWSGQKLVMNGDTPAEFSKEAFDAFLKIPGVVLLVMNKYREDAQAKEKN